MLAAFEAAARSGSVTAASELGLTQSAASRQIARPYPPLAAFRDWIGEEIGEDMLEKDGLAKRGRIGQ